MILEEQSKLYEKKNNNMFLKAIKLPFIQRYAEGDFDMIILNRFKNVSAISQIRMKGSER
jgi:hypothetical protein